MNDVPELPFRLAPYFHPTTFCIVDDNERFLRSLVLEMPPHIAYRAFSHPDPAIDYVNTPVEHEPLIDRLFKLERKAQGGSIIHFDMTLIEQEISNPDRFRRLSVALIDYAMPSVNGLQFFSRMRDPYTRKAMITGVADEKFAVELFNAGLIHHFVQKQQANDLASLLGYVAEIQQAYFYQFLQRLRLTLELETPPFLEDPVVALHVQEIMAEEGLVEYYLVKDPAGFILLRSNGSVVRLVLFDDRDRTEQISLARRHDAPPDVIARLQQGSHVFFFQGDAPENYHGGEQFPWEEYLLPATRLLGSRVWYAALARNPPMDIDFDPAISSYDAFLAGGHATS